jgi:hypothetical protein
MPVSLRRQRVSYEDMTHPVVMILPPPAASFPAAESGSEKVSGESATTFSCHTCMEVFNGEQDVTQMTQLLLKTNADRIIMMKETISNLNLNVPIT